jgi:uncharacterized membrane protein HdeD (DUF308 family)
MIMDINFSSFQMSGSKKPPVALVSQVVADNDCFGSDQLVHPGNTKLIREDNLQSTSWNTSPLSVLLKRTTITGAFLILVGILVIVVGGLTYYSRGNSSRHLFEGCLVGSTSLLSGIAALTFKFICKNLKKHEDIVRYTAFLILLGIANFTIGFCDCFFVIFKLVTAHNVLKSGVESEFQPYDPRSHTMFLAFAVLHMVLIVSMMILGIVLMFSAVRIRHETVGEKKQKDTAGSSDW